MSGSRARRRPGEETDQCAAEWKASNTLLLTRPKHFEACFHREQLVCETAGVKLTLPAPHLPFLPASRWMTLSFGREPPQQWRQPAAIMGPIRGRPNAPASQKAPAAPHLPRPPPQPPAPRAPGNRIQSTRSLSARLRAAQIDCNGFIARRETWLFSRLCCRLASTPGREEAGPPRQQWIG